MEMMPPRTRSHTRPRAKKSLTPARIKKIFGVDPRCVGVSHLSWFLLKEPSAEDVAVGAKSKYLCVRTFDKAYGHFDEAAMSRTNFIGISNDMFETERTNYYFRPLENGL